MIYLNNNMENDKLFKSAMPLDMIVIISSYLEAQYLFSFMYTCKCLQKYIINRRIDFGYYNQIITVCEISKFNEKDAEKYLRWLKNINYYSTKYLLYELLNNNSNFIKNMIKKENQTKIQEVMAVHPPQKLWINRQIIDIELGQILFDYLLKMADGEFLN